MGGLIAQGRGAQDSCASLRVLAFGLTSRIAIALAAVLVTSRLGSAAPAGAANEAPDSTSGNLDDARVPHVADAAANEEALTDEDVRGMRLLFARLATAMTAGDADGIGELLSPALSPDEQQQIVSRARGEFERMLYRKFTFSLDDNPAADRLGPGLFEVLVHASYEYEARTEGQGRIAGTDDTAYPFRLAKTDDEWLIVWSELVDQFGTQRMQQVLGWMFLAVFLAVIVVFFWGWMALDAYVRTGRTGSSLAVLLTPPVGALVYFFAVYLRRSFIRRGED